MTVSHDDHAPQTAPIDPVPDAVAALEEPVLLPPRGLWAVALALFALAAVVAVFWAPPARTPVSPHLFLDLWRQTDVTELRARDDALLRQTPTPDVARLNQQILTNFAAYLQREATLESGVDQDPEARALLGRVEEDVRQVVQLGKADAFHRLAVQFGRDVVVKSEAAIAGAQRRHESLDAHLHAQPLPDDVSALQASAGGLGRVLARTGMDRFVRGGVLEPAAAQVVEAIAQARFLQLGARVQGELPQLPSDAWLLVQRFRVEAHQSLDLTRRLALLDDLAKADPSYPSDYVRGVLLAREERFAEANAAFVRAGTSGALAKQARDNAKWCRAQMGREQVSRGPGQAPAAPPHPAP